MGTHTDKKAAPAATGKPGRDAPDANEGEGNKTADRNYREATQKFVESERGQEKIRGAGHLSGAEERDVEAAEERAKAHAKDHDPEEVRAPRK
jgi:hypothetical protein